MSSWDSLGQVGTGEVKLGQVKLGLVGLVKTGQGNLEHVKSSWDQPIQVGKA